MGDAEKVEGFWLTEKCREKRRRNGNLEYSWSARFHT